MNLIFSRPLTTAFLVAFGYVLPVSAEPAGTLVFVQDGVQIINAGGQARPARQGDVLQTGERLQTPPNAITQIKLPDGSLMGMRPGAELRIDPPAAGSGHQSPEVALLQGAIRVVGVELMDRSKTSGLILKTGQTSVQLTGADIESAVLKPEVRPTGETPGTYNRLAVGSATLRSGSIVEPLPIRQVSFVPANSPVPAILATVGPTVFAATRSQTAPLLPRVGAGEGVSMVSNMTSTLTAPRPNVSGAGAPPGALGTGAPGPLPVFSPISTGAVNPTAGDRPAAGAAPIGGGGLGGTAGVRPPPPPPPPVAILPPIRPPVICRPNPLAGRPPICT